jgi:predicted TIM-barrel fold metal-dependent hydrolase
MELGRRASLAGLAACIARSGRANERRLFDSHFHVVDPRFPLVVNQGYLPPPFPLDAYLSSARPLGVIAGAVVSGSFQGYDQTYLADTLSRLGPGWVGVAQISPDTPDAEIARLAGLGVRALRFNILRGDSADIGGVIALALRCHDVAGWHAEFYADAADLRPHATRLQKLPLLSLDHLGMTEAGLPVVIDLVTAGAFVKASGFGRVSLEVPKALEAIAGRSPTALVFGSDMPSTRAKVPFRPSDIDLIETVLGPDHATRVFWDNPRALYRVASG